MRFYIETKVENGVEKIVTHSNPTDKRKALYRVMDEQGNKQVVEKQWLLANKDNVVNLSVSGNAIRVKNSKQGKVKERVVKFSPEVEAVIEKRLCGQSSTYITYVLLDLLPIVITQKLKSTVAPDIEIKRIGNVGRDGFCYGLNVTQNAYKFPKGELSIKCKYVFDYKYVKVNGKCEKHKFINLYLYLLNQCEETSYYTNTYNTYTALKTLFNFSEECCNLYDNLKCKTYEELEKPVKNMFQLDEHGEGYYVDEIQGRQILLSIVKSVTQFIDTNKDIILNKLYLKDSVTTDDYKYKVVDKCHGYHFPDASKSIEKAEKLEKEGYTLYVNGTKMCAKQFKVKCQKDLGAGSYCMSGYTSVSEYVDKPNKAFYVLLGSVEKDDFYC